MSTNTYILPDSDQSWRDDQAALDDWRRDMAKEHGTGCGSCPEWCDLYMVSIGAPGCAETFPQCELMRDLGRG